MDETSDVEWKSEVRRDETAYTRRLTIMEEENYVIYRSAGDRSKGKGVGN